MQSSFHGEEGGGDSEQSNGCDCTDSQTGGEYTVKFPNAHEPLGNKIRQIKIADFGLAAICRVGQKLSTQCGSMPFASPELMNVKSYCGFKCDVWSCGVVLLEIVCKLNKFERIMNWPRDGSLVASPERAREVEERFSCCVGMDNYSNNINSAGLSLLHNTFNNNNISSSQQDQNNNNNNEDNINPNNAASNASKMKKLHQVILSDLPAKYVRKNPEGTKHLMQLLLEMMFVPKAHKRATMSQVASSPWVNISRYGENRLNSHAVTSKEGNN